MIRQFTHEQEKLLRDTLICDTVYMMVHDTLRSMRPATTSLSHVQIWIAATEFTTRLLQLPEAEELLPDEVEDLMLEAKGKNDAVLVMTTTICQLSALHKKEPVADVIIRGLMPYVTANPIYRQMLESIGNKEQRMAERGKTVDFHSYELTEAQVKEERDKGAERIFNFFVDNLENMSPKTAEAVMLQLNWLNLQEGCRYNNLILKGFSTMHDKMNVRPLIRVENGDYVIDKYVENEIGKVETGATGITINKTNKI